MSKLPHYMFHSVANSSPTPLWSWKMSVVRSFEDLCLLHMGESLDESLPAKLLFLLVIMQC